MATNVSSAGLLGQTLGSPFVFGLRTLFYVCSPGESSFPTVDAVPDYVNKAVPFFFLLITLELAVLGVQGRLQGVRPNDMFSSLSAGIISLLPLLLMRNIEMSAYMYVHKNHRVTSLPWDSAWTWTIAMLGVDLGYYWVHRMAHEVNFMWAAHQVHHSSEEYNLTTALRQSVLQRYSSWIFYLPMAFFLPPSIFKVHIQLNLLYQFWIHTEVVDRLGPLEWVMNTPSHHRVHHGRNRYCIDTNYAGVFIIWDRMFGTFTPENKEDKVVYGLVHPLKSWIPIHTQLCHWKYILRMMGRRAGLTNKLSVLLKGPGWAPGKPRLGLRTDLPDVHAPQKSYNKTVSLFVNLYVWSHFLIALASQQVLAAKRQEWDFFVLTAAICYMLWTLTNVGLFYEQKPHAPLSELLRIGVYLMVDSYVCGGATCHPGLYFLRLFFLVSGAGCALVMARSSFTTSKPRKTD